MVGVGVWVDLITTQFILYNPSEASAATATAAIIDSKHAP